MKSNKNILIIIIIAIICVIGLIMGSFVGKYNSIVTKEETVSEAMSNVDTALQRRADLIPNLVSTVKGYASHEQDAINKVSEARTKLMNAESMSDKAKANDELSSAITKVLALQENYPDLKADKVFIGLQDELAGSENRIAVARKDYNSSVKDYNAYIKKFPTNIIANMSGHGTKDYFKASESAKDVPEVSF
ncbi:MAG: LemA family protein [Tenericutes bacterium]|nr:LemA family protein [Mycoplasmatota bacterium]